MCRCGAFFPNNYSLLRHCYRSFHAIPVFMKKTPRRILIITTLGILLGAGLFAAATAFLQKYKWEINIFLYGKKEAKKQEFIYHSQATLQKAFAPSSPDSPNVILISLDTLRAQSMGCYGFKKKTTPFLDQFAREGVLFENMCAASTSTPPSHMSIMTGLYRSVH